MISRRSFIKYSGFAALALGTGYSTGKIFENKSRKRISLHAFLPGDANILQEVIDAFKNKIGSAYIPVVKTDPEYDSLNKILKSSFNKADFFTNNSLDVKIYKSGNDIKSDLFITSSEKYIYNPDAEFDETLTRLRNKIKNRMALYFLSIDFSENSFISSLFKSNRKILILENEDGIIDKINFNRDYKSLEINGAVGKTNIRVFNGSVNVIKSSCRHRLCEKKGIISGTGDLIACVPNKILIKIENT